MKRRRRWGRKLLLLIVAAFVLWFGLRLMGGAYAVKNWQARGIAVQEGTAAALVRLSLKDGRVQEILDKPEAYPPAFLDMLAKNSETLDFVLGYPSHREDPPPQSLDEPLDSVPLLLQWDMRWGYQPYGESTVAVSGCAPASLAMAAAYVTGNASITPYSVAQTAAQQGYYIPGEGTSWELMNIGAAAFGVVCEQLSLDKAQIDAALTAGHPVICSMLPGDFTSSGHFIVLSGKEDGGYAVRDPNSRERSGKVWSYDTLSGQIAALWSCRAA
ncbi:C39 family peptidase [Agathobaculum sp.]|uniref:C39 family peptidase n=1 Tax=Agathobaculum sp. TaxID=2048138 RepID=UPI002A7F8A30|nr:C39 family peptidase [Agathobaculum sp.]MDY3618665.1 C39 family peptidase [Agathobaculum sp.]